MYQKEWSTGCSNSWNSPPPLFPLSILKPGKTMNYPSPSSYNAFRLAAGHIEVARSPNDCANPTDAQNMCHRQQATTAIPDNTNRKIVSHKYKTQRSSISGPRATRAVETRHYCLLLLRNYIQWRREYRRGWNASIPSPALPAVTRPHWRRLL